MDKTLYYKSNKRLYGKNRILIILIVLLIYSCNYDSTEVRILFVGDILLSRNVKEEYNKRKTSPWENLKQLFHSSDLVIGNLEGAVGDINEQINPSFESPVFAIDSNDIALLNVAGFNAITIANNHIFDLGQEGKSRTISTLIKKGIKPVSIENSPNFIKVKNKVISIIAVNLILNRDSSKYTIPSIELKQKLRLAKSLSNIVIVSIHWGSELLDWPSKAQREAAKWFISNGVDIIIGHHPHIIQKPELIDGKPVFFSLGNHLFDQKYTDTKEGLIVEIKIKNGKYYCNGLKTHTQKNSFYPEINEPFKKIFKPIKYNEDLFTINNITLIPFTIDSENKTILQAFKNSSLIWKSHPLSLVTLEKIKIEDKTEWLFALEEYYSSLDKEINIRPYIYRVDENGLLAKWRGSALAWPILDARISPNDEKILCALHRGDAFISLGNNINKQRTAAYRWNGFGFNGINDSIACMSCKDIFK